MKKLNIVARFNEDIEWAKQLDGDVIIYNKGNNWPWEDIPRIDVENYGREGETFVRAAIELYDLIKDYDSVIFLQGNPFDHCKNLFSIIDNQKELSIFALADSVHRDIYNDNRRIFNIHPSIINLLLNLKHLNEEFIPEFCKLDNETNTILEQEVDKTWFIDNVTLCTVLGLDHLDKDNYWGEGAQYIVPTELIINKSKNWWQNLHYLFYYLCKENNEYDWTYILERIWPLIWQHSDL